MVLSSSVTCILPTIIDNHWPIMTHFENDQLFVITAISVRNMRLQETLCGWILAGSSYARNAELV